MALNLEQWNGSAWVAVDITAQRLSNFRLTIEYGVPAQLTFEAQQAHHTIAPIDPFTPVRFWDDAGEDPDTDPWADDNPNFLGTVEDVDPGPDGHTLNYTCFDPTVRAGNKIRVMSTTWTDADTPAATAIPRIIFNAHIDTDDDWQFCRNDPATPITVGAMIKIILDDAIAPLRDVFAAPDSPGVPYVQAELDELTFVPQSKVVITDQSIGRAVQDLLSRYEPEHRLVFSPRDRQWHFHKITTSTAVTRTLNDFTETNPILQFQVDRNMKDRYTAVEIFGPEAVENRIVSVNDTDGDSDGSMSSTSGVQLDDSPLTIAPRAWQIDDTDKRRIGRVLPTPIVAPGAESEIAGASGFQRGFIVTQSPSLQVKYTASAYGSANWQSVTGFYLDAIEGTIQFGPTVEGSPQRVCLYRPKPGASPAFEVPADVKFIYPSFIAPLEVRSPASSFDGTCFDDFGLESVLRIYDEALAVGYVANQPVTTSTRTAAYQVIADKLLEYHKDISYTGGCVLEGLDYTFAELDRRMHFDGVDGDGDPLTTGWEAMNAFVTAVEYDFSEGLTALTFSSDRMAEIGQDPELMKERLKIRAQDIRFEFFWQVEKRFGTARTGFGRTILGSDITVSVDVVPFAFDPFTGGKERVFGTQPFDPLMMQLFQPTFAPTARPGAHPTEQLMVSMTPPAPGFVDSTGFPSVGHIPSSIWEPQWFGGAGF